MSDALTESMPLYGSSEKAGETTPGGQEPTQFIEVAVNLSPLEASVIKGRLESENILALIVQESIGSVMGLTIGPLGAAKVLVPEDLAERALSILAETYDLEDDYEDEYD